MKRAFCFFVFFGLIVFTAPAEEPVLTVINETGYDIYYLYITGSGAEDWGEDLLDGYILADGDSCKITLPSAGEWDVQAENEDGDTYTLMNVSITRNRTVVVEAGDID